MSPKTDTEVLIGGKVFTLSGYESEDYMQKIASYINNKMTEYGKTDSYQFIYPLVLSPDEQFFWHLRSTASVALFPVFPHFPA